ncbi:LLM class flavin-dependent oxidoreductase [Saccharomonospora saliphila]|uniref:LLM class flavin-dependent oxidoreductase n=1 Tax=Saccharomonospora saliphila TaxID=369829 RepID=UPI0003717869|nr:LLM class flavin-dependent oxidoreductase [Saccharomonospora saliphila]
MHFGIALFPTIGPRVKTAQQYYDESLGLADLADELGLDHVKTVEHYFFDYGGYSPDPVTFLAAAAGRTRRVRLGTSAVIPAFTHPVKLAGKLAMLDNISHGRLDVAFGRAFLPDEFEAFGIPLDESRARFREGLAACKRLWTEEGTVFEGEFHRFGPVTLQPRPAQRPHPPVYVTSARSPESCVEAGRAGHNLQIVPGVLATEDLKDRLATYRRAWAEGGHTPGAEKVHFSYPCVIAEDGAEARRLAALDDERNGAAIGEAVQSWSRVNSADYPGYDKLADTAARATYEDKRAQNKVLSGTPEEVTRQLETIAEWFGPDIGISLGIHSGHLPAEVARRTMHLLAEKIAPKF